MFTAFYICRISWNKGQSLIKHPPGRENVTKRTYFDQKPTTSPQQKIHCMLFLDVDNADGAQMEELPGPHHLRDLKLGNRHEIQNFKKNLL